MEKFPEPPDRPSSPAPVETPSPQPPEHPGPGPTNPLPKPPIRRHVHLAASIVCTTVIITAAACGREDRRPFTSTSGNDAAAAISQRYIGCIGPTAQPNIFVFSVAEGRDFTTGEPPGTPIPQKSELPEGAPPPIPPVTVTTGSPGGGPTPTTKITTYSLIADGGTNLRSYVGHTVEILGRPEERPGGNSTAAPTEPTRILYATSIRDLADHCR